MNEFLQMRDHEIERDSKLLANQQCSQVRFIVVFHLNSEIDCNEQLNQSICKTLGQTMNLQIVCIDHI
jgi:hypothetical protein